MLAHTEIGTRIMANANMSHASMVIVLLLHNIYG